MKSDLFIKLTTPNGVAYDQPIGLFINNEWRHSKLGDSITVISPIDGSTIGQVEAGGEADINDAVRAARLALSGSWGGLSGTERGTLMHKLADLVEGLTHTFASIDTWNNGKPIKSAAGDVGELVGVLRYYAGFADKLHGHVIDVGNNKLAYTNREPIGVCGQIIPWNYPLGMAAWKIGPALAAGNTLVLKPSEQTPLSVLLLATLIGKAGFPPGVVNIVNGLGRTAGASLASHTDVDKVAFTGSTNTGREIMKLAASNLKVVTMETGGKSPAIVLADCDLENAVKWCHYGIMANQGQICTSTSRILVQHEIYDGFIDRFTNHVKKTSIIGDPFAKDTFQGPQVSLAQYEKILAYIELGTQEGATLVAGGKPVDSPGFFIEPTIFADVRDHMRIYREEIFGPLVTISPFDTVDEAITMANDTTYGLGAALFTENITLGHRLARKIEAGMVWINSSNDSDFRIPFGGVKQSGFGRELGEEGVLAYTTVKSIHVNMAVRDS